MDLAGKAGIKSGKNYFFYLLNFFVSN